MATVQTLNEIAQVDEKVAPNNGGGVGGKYVKYDSLETGKAYKVHFFGELESNLFNKTRTCVTVGIEDGYLILPERFDKSLQTMKAMKTDNLFIIFKGRKTRKNGPGSFLDISFEEKE